MNKKLIIRVTLEIQIGDQRPSTRPMQRFMEIVGSSLILTKKIGKGKK